MKRIMKNKIRAVIGAALSICMTFSGLLGGSSYTVEAAGNLEQAIEFKSAKSYGGLYEDKFEAAAYTKDGGFVAAGYSMGDSSDPEWEWHSKTNHAYDDAIIVKPKIEQNYTRFH